MKNDYSLVHNEFILQRYGNGMKTVRPENIGNFSGSICKYSVATLLELPFCVYFLNTNSQDICLNPDALKACGYSSMKEAWGKSMFDVTSEETAIQITNVHKQIMRLNHPQFTEEDVLCKDNRSFQCISCVFPWYDESNNIIGVLGYSVIPAEHSLPAALTAIFNTGFSDGSSYANNSSNNLLPNRLIDDVYLSKREYQCVQLLKQGYTSKMIGKALNLSHRTVEHYIDNVKNKMGVFSKYDLIQKFL